MIYKGNNIQRTHDLILLNKKCINLDLDFKLIQEQCIELIPYGISVRYPYQLEVSEEDMMLAIKSSEEILKFIENKLKQPD